MALGMDTEGSCESSKRVGSREGQSEAFAGVCVCQKGAFFKRAFFFFQSIDIHGGLKKKKENQDKNKTKDQNNVLWCIVVLPFATAPGGRIRVPGRLH